MGAAIYVWLFVLPCVVIQAVLGLIGFVLQARAARCPRFGGFLILISILSTLALVLFPMFAGITASLYGRLVPFFIAPIVVTLLVTLVGRRLRRH